ncbi:MAG: depupylase/deamidase Dop [Acidimicrobiales bacterium]
MSIPKICGIETEYGISVVGAADMNPITSSSILINAYANEVAERTHWDFDGETPQRDARGMDSIVSFPPEVETHLVNTVLTNGARLYVDHAHPEYASPECRTPRDAVLFDRAGEIVLRRAMAAAQGGMPRGQSIVVYKNNSDGKGNTYGCHENYLMDRATPFVKIVRYITPFFVSRQIFTGAGKVGSEAPGLDHSVVPFQLTQRADFFEEEVGLETTLKRPIVNTRDEPHADASRYRRLHVIIGDANLSEYASFLKVGTTALVLAMIEDGALDDLDIVLSTPVRSLRQISYGLDLKTEVPTVGRGEMTALQIQWEYFERAVKYGDREGFGALGSEDQGAWLLEEWERILSALERDPMELADTLDWVAKLQIVSGYRERHGLAWSDSKLAAIDLQYHDLRPEKSLAARAGLRTLVPEEAVIRAVTEPPTDTRAYFRGRCLEKYRDSVAAANWDSLIFDVGSDPLRRVPMMDPLRGTAHHVDTLLERSGSVVELLRGLGAEG